MLAPFFLWISIAILISSFLCLIRAMAGPTIIDRIIAINVIGTKTISIILLIGLIYDRLEYFVDIAIVYALINFIGTLALSKYFESKGIST